MIRATFLHIPGVGPVTESELWRNGVRDWADVARLPPNASIPGPVRDRLAAAVRESEAALAERRVEYFARRLPPSEHWRLYPTFRTETAFLDIETTGLSPFEGTVTVVSVHGAGKTRTFVADEDLEELPAYLRRFRLLSTFNGRMFDVPFLESRFPGLSVPGVHIDLRFLLYRLGYAGGLKRIEQTLALGDRAGVEGIHGLDAVRLWEAYRRGDTDSLARLVKYNRADTVNLEPLLEFAVARLSERLLPRGNA
ncbi:MAG TPA: ribonuclease H-like domain-containing protein [Thermoplasmata archaeon]|nr:ribonuclease H-like domain-containing protein [Thermoplasmata archaeon]